MGDLILAMENATNLLDYIDETLFTIEDMEKERFIEIYGEDMYSELSSKYERMIGSIMKFEGGDIYEI